MNPNLLGSTNENEGVTTRFSLLSKDPSWGMLYAVCSFFSLLFVILSVYLPDKYFFFAKSSLIGFSLLSVLRYSFAVILPTVFFVYFYRVPDKRLLGTNPGLGAFMLSALAGVPFAVLMISLKNFQTFFLVTNKLSIPAAAFLFHPGDSSPEAQGLTIIVSVLLPILAEELLFRGFLVSVLPQHKYPAAGILLSAVLYALFCFDPENVFPAFLTGLLLAFVRRNTGNIVGPILTRLAMFLTVSVFTKFLPILDLRSIHGKADFEMTFFYTSVAASVICLIGFIPVISQLHLFGKENRHNEESDPDQTEKSDFLHSIGVIPFLIGLLLTCCGWVILIGI